MRKPCEVHVPSLATGFLMLDTAPYCAVCFKRLEEGDPVTHQVGESKSFTYTKAIAYTNVTHDDWVMAEEEEK